MTTPLATIAESIIEFILSLLRDPDAAAEFARDPEAALARSGLSGVSAADVRAVAPVIYDRDDVMPRAGTGGGSGDHSSSSSPATVIHVNVPQSPPAASVDPVIAEFTRITSSVTTSVTTIDNRSTIVDQSVNQNIWSEGGDVTQLFDQTAGIATGDDATAAGGDVTGADGEPAAGVTDALDDLDDLLTAGADAAGALDDDLDDAAGSGETPATDGTAQGQTDGDVQGETDGAAQDDPEDAQGTTGDAEGTTDAATDAASDLATADDVDDLLDELAAAAADEAGAPSEAVEVIEQVPSSDPAADAQPEEPGAEASDKPVETTADDPAPTAAYDAAVASTEEAAWAEADDTTVVDDLAYADEMTEEQ